MSTPDDLHANLDIPLIGALPSPTDDVWLKRKVDSGELPEEAAPPAEKRKKLGRPRNVDMPLGYVAPTVKRDKTSTINSRTRPMGASERTDGKYRNWRREEHDLKLSQADWQAVYKEYARTGMYAEIATRLHMDTRRVKHLIEYGIVRLGLPPIREHAVDLEEVNKRSELLVGKPEALVPKGEALPIPVLANMPDIKQAVTERVVRETAAAQATLLATVKTTDVFLGYINKILERLADPEGGYFVPDKIMPNTVEQLVKMVNNLATANEKAVQASRLAAGEPTQNIVYQVAAFATQLTSEELRHYALTRELPVHLRVKGGSRDNGPIEARIIDIKSEDQELPSIAPPPPSIYDPNANGNSNG